MGPQAWDVDTSGPIDMIDIDVVGPKGRRRTRTLIRSGAQCVSIGLSRLIGKIQFVDVGCGKRRVLMVGSIAGVRQNFGIEFAPLESVKSQEQKYLCAFPAGGRDDWLSSLPDATTVICRPARIAVYREPL